MRRMPNSNSKAENYSALRESSVSTLWDFIDVPEDYSGEEAMQALPAGENRHKVIEDAQDFAPVLKYAINFVTDDPVYVWARSSHIDGYDDSAWFGLDGQIEGTAPIQYMLEEQDYKDVWYWISHLMNDNNDRAILEVPSTGVHIFEIYMREPSYKIDKIVLTTDEEYIPDDDDEKGPPETLVETDVESFEGVVPQELRLAQNYPNPFNPVTTIPYAIPEKSLVTLTIYNIAGQVVEVLVDQKMNPGYYSVQWDASKVGSGIYFYRIAADEFSDVKKCVIIK